MPETEVDYQKVLNVVMNQRNDALNRVAILEALLQQEKEKEEKE